MRLELNLKAAILSLFSPIIAHSQIDVRYDRNRVKNVTSERYDRMDCQ